MTIRIEMEAMGKAAREASRALRNASAETRTEAIRAMARHIRDHRSQILAANAADVAEASGMVDRLRLDQARLDAMARSIEEVAALPDPVGVEPSAGNDRTA